GERGSSGFVKDLEGDGVGSRVGVVVSGVVANEFVVGRAWIAKIPLVSGGGWVADVEAAGECVNVDGHSRHDGCAHWSGDARDRCRAGTDHRRAVAYAG